MAAPKATSIAQFLLEEVVDGSPVRLRVAIARSLSRRTSLSAESVAEYAESLEDDVLRELFRIASEDRERGADPSYRIDAADGEPYILGLDGPIRPIRARLLRLEPTPFEHACLAVLRHLGAEGEVSGGPGDGGIDFRASGLRFGAPPISSVSRGLVSVLGQAKRYAVDNIITVKDLREFVGAATLRIQELRRVDSRFSTLSPIALAFWTTSDFHSSAVQYARDLGIWILNGRGIAQLLLESRFPIDELGGEQS